MSYHEQDFSTLPLGKAVSYSTQYNPNLLQPIARSLGRSQLGISEQQTIFCGADLWTLYELSWLNRRGLPQVAIGEVEFPASSQFLIESKSFKLYLNSLNQSQFTSWQQLSDTLTKDLSQACTSTVKVRLFKLSDYPNAVNQQFIANCIDEQDIELTQYQYQPQLLRNSTQPQLVSENLVSHLLKSNCLITKQPDWGSVLISYTGQQINRAKLLSYLVSFRGHNEFHEQCVERIFCDLKHYCQPQQLTVYARYTRRGGLDINPWRSTVASQPDYTPLSRQ